MARVLVCFCWIGAALAQPPAIDPVTASIQAVWNAQRNGAPVDSTLRDQARQALAQAPVASPQYGGWAQSVAQFYGNGAQARAVLEEALARTEALPKNSATRIALLSGLSNLWQQDRNLLQALAYAEQAVQYAAAAPPASAGYAGGVFRSSLGGPIPVGGSFVEYQRLAQLYRELGRPQDLAALTAKLAASGTNDALLMSLYEQEGQFDEAEKIYQRQVDGAENPRQKMAALQNLGSFYQRRQRYGDAVLALQQAIATAATIASNGAPNQSFWLRQQLANLLHQAGRNDDADALYQQLLAESQSMPGNVYSQTLAGYANYLGSTNRAQQGESLLTGYLDSGSNLEPWERSNLLSSLSGVAHQSGDTARAEQYRKAAADIQQKMMAAGDAGGPPGITISKTLEDASAAMNAGKMEDAFTLVLQAIGAAPAARDRFQLVSRASNIAIQMAQKKAAGKAQAIFDRLFVAVETGDDGTAVENLQQLYVRLLMNEGRWDDAADAIERYRDVLTADHGAGTGWLEQYYRLKIEVERAHDAKREAASTAAEFLKFEITLSGDTSEPYLNALELAAPVLEQSGATESALALYRRSVTVVDLTDTAGDNRRGQIRMNVAYALARAGQFDEAEELCRQAMAISSGFSAQLQQILNMKSAAASK
jgi:tetratricopeptide (TPR) repeat protein